MAATWNAMRETAIAAQLPVSELPIYGSDLYGDALKAAHQNLEEAGIRVGKVQITAGLKVALPEAPPDAVERRFHVHRRDLDPMGHVNNSVYLDYFEEALEAAGQGQRLNATPRRYVLEFASSAARDETLVDRAWPLGGGWAYRLTGEDGREILRAQLDLL